MITKTWATADMSKTALENEYRKLYAEVKSHDREMKDASAHVFDEKTSIGKEKWTNRYNEAFRKKDHAQEQLYDVNYELKDLYEKNPELASRDVLQMMKDFTGSAPVSIQKDELERD